MAKKCDGSGKPWLKTEKKTRCSVCKQPISKLSGHPMKVVPYHET